MTSSRSILEPGTTCATCTDCERSGLLIDGRDYYRAVYDLCSQAQKSILMLGWQFDSRTELLRGDDAKGARYPLAFLPFMRALCEEKPDLHINLLAWEASPIFVLEREPFQWAKFHIGSHPRLRFVLDADHPFAASQHQKLLVVDESIAVLGGMDVCASRWDDREHSASNPHRRKLFPGFGTYHPYHDVQAYVTGEPVHTLRQWFAERWHRATDEPLALGDAPCHELRFTPSVEMEGNHKVGLTRTLPPEDDEEPVYELRKLHLQAIARAERLIYIENQYFTSHEIRKALIDRMRASNQQTLGIVIVLPRGSAGLKEQVAIGVRQSEILRELEEVSAETGHEVGAYYAAASDAKNNDVPVFIHAKVLSVDDRFLLISSANTTNRSMGLDSELGLAWESDEECKSVRRARLELMGEHCGIEGHEAEELLTDPQGLVLRLDALADRKSHRLRRHPMRKGQELGVALAHFAQAANLPLDPGEPVMENVLPEPSGLFSPRWKQRLRLGFRRVRRALDRSVLRSVFAQRRH